MIQLTHKSEYVKSFLVQFSKLHARQLVSKEASRAVCLCQWQIFSFVSLLPSYVELSNGCFVKTLYYLIYYRTHACGRSSLMSWVVSSSFTSCILIDWLLWSRCIGSIFECCSGIKLKSSVFGCLQHMQSSSSQIVCKTDSLALFLYHLYIC